jgi:hypothetical protein
MIRPRLGWAVRSLAAVSFLATLTCTSGSEPSTTTEPTSPAPSAAATCGMQIDQSASGVHGNLFAAVSGRNPKDVWAVGTHFESSKPNPLVEHWDGSSWKNSLAQGGRFHGLQLTDVAVVAPDDVWAVGFVYGGASAMHWDGSTWTQAPTALGLPGSDLLGVTALGPSDIWAVGKVPGDDGYDDPLVEHWDGSAWNVVPNPPSQALHAGLHDIAASGSASVWAVGWTVGEDKVYRPLIERRDGDRWVVVQAPHLADDAVLSGVTIDGRGDVWAVGWSWKADVTRSLILHRVGSSWKILRLPGRTGSSARLAAVASSGGDIVTAGQAPDAQGILQPVAFRLDGSTWTAHAAGVGESGGGFLGVASFAGIGMVAVGHQIVDEGYSSLIQQGC